jgi:MFS transporter, ACDE family, multidrug resistance protein
VPKQKKTLDLATLASIPFIMVLGNSMLIPILPQIQQELNLNQLQVSLIITSFSIAAAFMIPLTGFLSDHYGRKKVIIPALLLFGLGGIIAGLGAWFLQEKAAYWTIMASRVLQGIGAAGTAPITMALVGDIFHGGAQSKALGIVEATNGLGKVASPIVGTLIAMITWFAPFFAFPILCFLAVAALIFWAKEPEHEGKPQALGGYVHDIGQVFKTEGRWLLATFFSGSVGLFAMFGLLFYLSDILETRFQIEGMTKGYILALPLLAMVTTAYLTGRFIKKKFPLMKAFILIGLFMMAASLIPMIFFKKLWVLCLLLFFTGIGTGLVLPCVNSFIIGSVGKAKRGMITSLYGGVRFAGVALGPPAFGWLMAKKEWILFSSNALLLVLALLWAMWAIQVRSKGDQPDEKNGWKRMSFSKT